LPSTNLWTRICQTPFLILVICPFGRGIVAKIINQV
jgi:hypothetical protein